MESLLSLAGSETAECLTLLKRLLFTHARRERSHSSVCHVSGVQQRLVVSWQGSVPASLKEVLATADAVKTRQVLQSMSQHLIPIMEKGLVDPLLSHR